MHNNKATWYATASAGNHQDIIIDELTGATIAITYQKQVAPLLAAAPDLLAALQKCAGHFANCFDRVDEEGEPINPPPAFFGEVLDAIAAATGEDVA